MGTGQKLGTAVTAAALQQHLSLSLGKSLKVTVFTSQAHFICIKAIINNFYFVGQLVAIVADALVNTMVNCIVYCSAILFLCCALKSYDTYNLCVST